MTTDYPITLEAFQALLRVLARTLATLDDSSRQDFLEELKRQGQAFPPEVGMRDAPAIVLLGWIAVLDTLADDPDYVFPSTWGMWEGGS